MAGIQSSERPMPVWARWTWALLAACAVVGLFVMTWKSQFAAPPGYLFATPSQPIEAGYCLSVAQEIGSDGYVDEAVRFWIARLGSYGADMGRAIAEGRAALGRDQALQEARGVKWLFYALDQCSNRAVTYGAHFESFN